MKLKCLVLKVFEVPVLTGFSHPILSILQALETTAKGMNLEVCLEKSGSPR